MSNAWLELRRSWVRIPTASQIFFRDFLLSLDALDIVQDVFGCLTLDALKGGYVFKEVRVPYL